MKVLLVDDSRAMRLLVTRMIKKLGIAGGDISEADDGDVALEMIKKSVPDLVLSDWNMPNMNGIDLLAALNTEGITPTFGFITTEATEEMRDKAMGAGAKFLITKPFTQDSMEEALDPYL